LYVFVRIPSCATIIYAWYLFNYLIRLLTCSDGLCHRFQRGKPLATATLYRDWGNFALQIAPHHASGQLLTLDATDGVFLTSSAAACSFVKRLKKLANCQPLINVKACQRALFMFEQNEYLLANVASLNNRAAI